MNFGPAFCARLDAEPPPSTSTTSPEGSSACGWYFFQDEAEQITAASISTYCPQHQGLYFGTKFGEGFLQGLPGG